MIKKDNERLMITLSKNQVKWLKESAKKLNLTTSQFVKILIDRNIANIAKHFLTEEELKELIRIAKTPWLDS